MAREPQPQHALQLGDGNMEGSSTGECLDNWLRQIGGEEAQLKTKHTQLGHKRFKLQAMSVIQSASLNKKKDLICIIILFYDFVFNT